MSQNVLVPDLSREWEESDPLRASSILSWFLLAMTEPFAKTSPRRQKRVLLELWLWFLMGSNKSKIYFTILAESRALSWIIWKSLMVRDSREVRFLLDFLKVYEGSVKQLYFQSPLVPLSHMGRHFHCYWSHCISCLSFIRVTPLHWFMREYVGGIGLSRWF